MPRNFNPECALIAFYPQRFKQALMGRRSFKGQMVGGEDKKKGRDHVGKNGSHIHHNPNLTGHPEEFAEVEKSGALTLSSRHI